VETKWRAVGVLGGFCSLAVWLMGGCGSPIDPAAESQFKQALGHTSITVFPAVIRTEKIAYDAAAAQRLGQFLKDQGLAEATVANADVPITGGWSYNEAAMWRQSAAALADYVKKHPIATAYAMLPEYLGVTGKNPVGGVHLYVVDKDGQIVSGIQLNSHFKSFAEMDPKTADDCTALLMKVIPERWKAQ
jgi:hypothetical protein